MNINWKKSGFVAAILAIIFLTAFAIEQQSEVTCWVMEIKLDVSAEEALITEKQIEKEIIGIGTPIIGAPINEVNLYKIQTALNSNPLIKNPTVHKTVDGKLKINAEQRVPFVRIINVEGESFLVDKDGVKMPTLSSRNPRLMLFTGRINESLDGTTLSLLKVNEELRESSLLDEIFQVATFIETSDFWVNQVEHVYVNEEKEFELVPRVGSHKILLGESENIEDKLNRLEVFYKETIGKKNWNKYSTLDLRFKDQVVCKEINY